MEFCERILRDGRARDRGGFSVDVEAAAVADIAGRVYLIEVIAADLARAMGMSLEATVPDGRFTVTLWK